MKKLIAAAAAVVAVAGAQAATLSFSDTFGLSTTNWTDPVNATAFNPSLGTLTGVTITLSGDILQNISAENLGATPDVLTPIAGGSITLRRNGVAVSGGAIALNNPGTSFNASAFDGTNDFGGTSGIVFSGLTANGSVNLTFTGPALADFLGTGDLSSIFSVRSVGGGSVDSDNGNLRTEITTQARYTLEGVYTYTPTPVTTVPEPTSLALVGLALAGLGYASRRKA